MSRVSVLSFRVSVAAATSASLPLSVKLSPICASLVQLEMWCITTPALVTSGWRARDRNGTIVPDNGLDEAGITFGANEAGWAPLPNTRLKVPFMDKVLPGPPFDLTLEFYSTAAIEVGGILVVRDPVFGIHDLVLSMSSWMSKVKASKGE